MACLVFLNQLRDILASRERRASCVNSYCKVIAECSMKIPKSFTLKTRPKHFSSVFS